MTVGNDDGPVGLSEPGDGDAEPTIQLLINNEGNRQALRGLLAERYAVDTDQSVQEADLHIVEDRLVGTYRTELREMVERIYPVFQPVVLVRREGTQIGLPDFEEREMPPLVDDVLDAPIDRELLYRRLDTLLVRREQSEALKDQVSTLEARERELRQFKRAVERSGHSILITDSDGTIQYVNRAFERVTGYSASEAIGQTPRILKSGVHDKDFYRDLWETLLAGDVWQGEVVNERTDGEQYVVEQTIAPIVDDDSIEAFVSVNSEITERIQNQRELEQREEELDLLRQILSRVLRHNIRNDLNVILANAQRLETDLDDEYATIAETIIDTVGDIADLSESARTISSLTERGDDLAVQNLQDIVRRAVDNVRGQYPTVSFDVSAREECAVYASDELENAVTSLVENAAKHNDSDEPRVHVAAECGETADLVVEDNGPGIPEQELVPLDRNEETPLEHASSIGLWLINWVVERSGGTISFENTGNGTRVEIELPSSKPIREAALGQFEDDY